QTPAASLHCKPSQIKPETPTPPSLILHYFIQETPLKVGTLYPKPTLAISGERNRCHTSKTWLNSPLNYPMKTPPTIL
ncbi:hypothetical protein CCACVL1_30286, partial [Corchorus capsularis]